MATKTKTWIPDFAKASKEKRAYHARFRRAISKNMRVPLLTKAQVMKWYNMPASMLEKMPVAMLVDGEPRYIEYQLDHEIETWTT